jgi:hypothetical protein
MVNEMSTLGFDPHPSRDRRNNFLQRLDTDATMCDLLGVPFVRETI